MDYATVYIILACLIGLALTWGVGANDLANIMSTTMGSKAITVRQAIFVAIVFEFAGALLGSANVTTTLRTGIINTELLSHTPEILIYGMLAVLLAGTTWMITASIFGLPVSITNAIVGSIVGFGAVVLGTDAIHWKQVGLIAISWFLSPTIAGIIAYSILRSIQRSILGTINPLQNAQRYVPIYLFIVGLVLAFMTVLKGLKRSGIILTPLSSCLIAAGTALLVMVVGMVIMQRIHLNHIESRRERFDTVEKMFGVSMAFTACAMIFAHGSNDVAIAVGPMSAIITLAKHGPLEQNHIFWLLFFGCAGVILGFLMYGRRVIETVGSGITSLTPSRAFAATLAAASTVVVSTSTGIPVSATQTLVGAVLGVGLARGIGALNLTVIRNIFMSWMITIPAASLLTIVYFYLFKSIFA